MISKDQFLELFSAFTNGANLAPSGLSKLDEFSDAHGLRMDGTANQEALRCMLAQRQPLGEVRATENQ
jgi:hypothetical protein